MHTIVLQSDGKLLISGDFNNYGGVPRSHLARIQTDGSLDQSFNPGAMDGPVQSIGLTTNQSLVVGGRFTQVGGQLAPGLVRLRADGSFDAGFAPPLQLRTNVQFVQSFSRGFSESGPVPPPIKMVTHRDGKVVIDGRPFLIGGREIRSLMRLNADGSMDPTWKTELDLREWQLVSVFVAPDGSYWLAGNPGVMHLQSDGGLDPRSLIPQPVPLPQQFLVLSNGSVGVCGNALDLLTNSFPELMIVAGGEFYQLCAGLDQEGGVVLGGVVGGGIRAKGMARLSPDLALDLGFDPLGVPSSTTAFSPFIEAVVVDAQGRYLIGGEFDAFDGAPAPRLARLLPNNDSFPDQVYVAETTYVTKESAGPLHIQVIRSGAATGTNQVHYNTLSGSALAGTNFVAQSGELTFLPGERLKEVVIPILHDGLEKGWLSFVFALTEPSPGLELLDQHQAEVDIADIDFTYHLALQDTQRSLFEGGSPLRLWVTVRSQAKFGAYQESPYPSEDLFAVDIEELGAKLGRDYLPPQEPLFQIEDVGDGLDPTLMFAQFWLPIIDNTTWDGTRQLRFTLQSRSPRVIIDPPSSCLITISDNDSAAGPGQWLRGTVDRIAPGAGEKWYISGPFDVVDGRARPGLARLLPDGSLDADFDPGVGADGTITAINELTDGRVLIAGAFSHFAGAFRSGIVHLTPRGNVDDSFLPTTDWNSPSWTTQYQQSVVLPDQSVLLSALILGGGPGVVPRLIKLRPDGSADPTFSSDDLSLSSISAITAEADGTVLVAGTHWLTWQTDIQRLNSEGKRDEQFQIVTDGAVSQFLVTSSGDVWTISSDGIIILPSDMKAPRGTSAATAGRTIHSNCVYALAPQLGGGVLVTGCAPGFGTPAIFRFHDSGVLDTNFPTIYGEFSTIAATENGRIAAASTQIYQYPAVTRLDADGQFASDLHFASIVRLPTGEIHAALYGSGRNVQISSDLKRWSYIGLPQPFFGNLIDPGAVSVTRRFYRVH